MAIKGNIGVVPIDISTSDTTVLQVSSTPYERVAFSSCSIHNETTGTITVEFYSSPNLTSVSGTRVDNVIVPPNGTEESFAIVGQGFASGRNLLAVASAVGANVSVSYTGYTEGS